MTEIENLTEDIKIYNIPNKRKQSLFSNITHVFEKKAEASSLDILSNYNIAGLNPLNKYILSQNKKDYILSFNDAYTYMEDSNEIWDLFKDYTKDSYGGWNMYNAKDENKSPWKIHIYIDNIRDYMLLSTILLRYFIDKDINSKIVEPLELDTLNSNNQKGKAICIYPKSNEDFIEIAKDIDYIIKANGLQKNNSRILGDRKLGDTGRLFYRYEYKSKEQKDIILDLKKGQDYSLYCLYYDSNRLDDNYLANDMTQEDDPFLNLFNHNV